MAIEQPFDHNAECRYCDEQAMHRADCTWLVETLKKGEHFQRVAAALERELVAATQKIEALELLVTELLAAAKAAAKPHRE